jgi:hypothetical protein
MMVAVSIVTDINLKSENLIVRPCLLFHIRAFLDSKY